jgi:hypothetical protein
MKSNRTLRDKIIPRNKKDNLAEFCAPETSYSDRMIDVSSSVSLRVISFYPKLKPQPLPVVLVPRLVSVMLTFKNILLELTKNFVVHYVETREKSSSLVTGVTDYHVESIGRDIIEIISRLDLEEQKYVLLGTSLSATAIVESYNELTTYPFCLVLLEPNAVFDYPRWSLSIIRYSAPLYRFIKPVAKWYLRHFRVNTKEDYEMYEINSRALDAADPYKLRDVVLAISQYQIWGRLDSVKSPALVVCASKDTFHRHDDIAKMISMIQKSSYCDLGTHKRIHSREFVDRMRNFIGRTNYEQQQ